ncbi:MAG: hypothetical protein ACP5N2_01615 [Candidatus Nanoarchaeia archaeon]
MIKSNKKGQAGGGAAVLLIVITVLIVLYILFLPPADREALLANNSANSNTSSSSGLVLLRESPGTLDYIANDQKDYDFPSFTINTKVSGEVLTSRSSLYVKNSVFEKKEEVVVFSANPELTENVVLSFNIEKAEGSLRITLNGETMLDSDMVEGNSPPITIDAQKLQSSNELRFSVSSPGVAFWRYNEYRLKDVKITADVTDKSESESTQSFSLTAEDMKNLKTVQLRYIPVCNLHEISNMEVSINQNNLFRGLPDCGMYNYAPVAVEYLREGQNQMNFKVEKGSILIDRLRLTSNFETDNNPIYYFEMEESNFTNPDDPEDYALKSHLDVYMDLTFPNTNPKRFEIFINGMKIGFSTAKTKETRQIDNYVRPGTNSVEIKPLQDMTMTEIKIRLKNS